MKKMLQQFVKEVTLMFPGLIFCATAELPTALFESVNTSVNNNPR